MPWPRPRAGSSAVLAFDNGGVSDADAARLAQGGVTVLSDGGDNIGIAEALNRIAQAARAAGARGLLLLDQDAEPPPGPRDGAPARPWTGCARPGSQ